MDAFLKSAAQLRHLASRVTDPEAKERMLSFAREYEAMSAAKAAQGRRGRRRAISLKEPMLSSVEQWRGVNN